MCDVNPVVIMPTNNSSSEDKGASHPSQPCIYTLYLLIFEECMVRIDWDTKIEIQDLAQKEAYFSNIVEMFLKQGSST